VAGQLIVTGPVAKVGYRRIVVAGHVLLGGSEPE
jgi:hypothetical protein